MVVFLNFAPIEFMGGAEKWMNDTAKKINKYEESVIISVSPSLANIYGNLVLKRSYDKRIKASELNKNFQLTFASFIPFTKSYKKAKNYFSNARLIYSRYELSEYLLIFYFSGLNGINKSVAGVHTPLIYSNPDTLFGKLHNLLYKSKLSKVLLSKVFKVHVMNLRDEKFLENNFHLKNVVNIPNSILVSKEGIQKNINDEKNLHVLFVGELSKRKGVDILLEIIKTMPSHMTFTVLGDGYMKKDIEKLASTNSSVSYLGHVNSKDMPEIYEKHDALLLPSRAESMSIAILEALAHGLYIITSKEASYNISKNIEYQCNKLSDYKNALEKLALNKNINQLDRKLVGNYTKKNFSAKIIDPLLYEKVFQLNI